MDEKLWIIAPRSNIHALILITAAVTMAAFTKLAIILYDTLSTHSLEFGDNSLKYIFFKDIYIS